MAVTAQMVKELRDKTGAGMMDCKKALVESGGDEEKAVVYLREKGLAKAAKKVGRATSEGLMALHLSDDAKTGVLVEVKCETDFVAKNEQFQAFAADLAAKVAALDVTSGQADELPEDITDLTQLISTLGENMQLGRFVKISTDGFLGTYVHANGKIGVLVEFTGERNDELGKDLAMQVAAVSPACVTPDELPADVLEREKGIYKTQAMDEGKPEEIAEKIVMGRLNKFYKEVCLLEQPFIKDDKKTIKQLLKESGGQGVAGFVRLELGEDAEGDSEEE